MHNMEHALPQPLRKGRIRFHVKRGPQGWNTSDPKRVLAVAVYGLGKKKLGVIDVHGEWEREPFGVDGTAGRAYLSKKSWHEVEITVTPGAPANVSVDGQALGELPRGPVARVGFDCGHHGFMLDDVELLYAR
jgi:hypothetical protein